MKKVAELIESILQEPIPTEKFFDYESNLVCAISTLRANERRVLIDRFFYGRTLEISRLSIGVVSRERVRQIEAKAIRKLRHPSRRRIITGECPIGLFYGPPPPPEMRLDISINGKRANDVELKIFEWSVRTRNCFINSGITKLGELLERTEKDLLKINNFGRKSLNEVRWFLSDYGLTLKKEQ